MYEDTVVSLSNPDKISSDDPLTELLRAGARRLLADAVEAEVEAFIAEHAELTVDGGSPLVCPGQEPGRQEENHRQQEGMPHEDLFSHCILPVPAGGVGDRP